MQRPFDWLSDYFRYGHPFNPVMYERAIGILYHYAEWMLTSSSASKLTDAEDIVQDVMIKAMKHYANYDPSEDKPPFIFKLHIKWHIRNLEARKDPIKESLSIDDELTFPDDIPTNKGASLDTLPNLLDYENCYDKLRKHHPHLATIFEMYHIDGMTVSEIIQITYLSQQTIYNRRKAAEAHLLNCMKLSLIEAQ